MKLCKLCKGKHAKFTLLKNNPYKNLSKDFYNIVTFITYLNSILKHLSDTQLKSYVYVSLMGHVER